MTSTTTTPLRLKRPIHLVLDFDATLTVRDTIVLLLEIPFQRNKRLGREHDARREWSRLEEAYMRDYERHKASEQWKAGQSDTFVDQARAYSEMIAHRKVLEARSMDRLREWGVFKGCTREDVCRAAETVVQDGRLEMRDGWAEMLRLFSDSNGDETSSDSRVSIISLNWSSLFIQHSLQEALKLQPGWNSQLHDFIDYDLTIHANEIEGLDAVEGSDGSMRSLILGSEDKLKFMPAASKKETQICSNSKPNPSASHSIYVGDSSTDFDCLMAADMGIWLCPVSSQEEAQEKCTTTFKPLQLKVRHITDVDQDAVMAEDELIWAQNFQQITNLLANLAP